MAINGIYYGDIEKTYILGLIWQRLKILLMIPFARKKIYKRSSSLTLY